VSDNAAEPSPVAPLARPRRFKGVPLRFLLPNLVTLLALCLGLTSIRFAIEGRIETAVLAIIAAAVLDALDGRIARALKGTSKFGAEFDSLADFLDFGVAPALVLYQFSLHEVKGMGWFAVMVFAVACSLRLARFNVAIDDPDKPAWMGNFFVGMPAPAGAIVGLLPVYFNLLGLEHQTKYVPFEIAFTLMVALLMVSRIPHYSGKSMGRVEREHIVPVTFGVVATILLLATYPFEVLVGLTLLYLLAIPLSVRTYRRLAASTPAKTANEPNNRSPTPLD